MAQSIQVAIPLNRDIFLELYPDFKVLGLKVAIPLNRDIFLEPTWAVKSYR